MSRISTTFSRLADRDERALVAYVTVGDPDLETSYQVIETLCRAGADVLELGVPFSDPTADGPVIQRSSVRALAAGTTPGAILALVRRMRAAGHEQPVILFGYYNPFLQYGLARLAEDAAAAGVDGFLTVDLPPEEAGPFHAACQAHALDLIALLTPTSTPARVEAVRRIAGGFVYYVSRTGVTGAKVDGLENVNAQVARMQAALPLPICVGFGVAEPSQVAELGRQADGVVVGSAIVSMVERLGCGEETLEGIERIVRALKQPIAGALRV
ncbi:MAG TPA: tryptophan synthase subunit alpha [Oscillatoriaceae cyanobacterium]